MKILVTGSDGFIGSHLVEALINKGLNVRAFAFYNSQNNRGCLEYLDTKVLKKLDIISNPVLSIYKHILNT